MNGATLCDVCRQYRAIVEFNDTHCGVVWVRQVCTTCFNGYEIGSDLPQATGVLLSGRWQFCGARA